MIELILEPLSYPFMVRGLLAAAMVGTVCALERRATGGVLAPVLTHLVWGLIMVLALPPLFGL